MKAIALETAGNVIPLTIEPKPAKTPQHRQRFKIKAYSNPRTGGQSWRVAGIKRDGSRVRENFAEVEAAQCRQVELETEWLCRQTDTAIRATKLTDEQIRLAEAAFARLDDDADLLLAVEHWRRHGKQLSVVESPRLDDAIDQYLVWLASSPLRDATKRHWRTRMTVFKNSVSNHRVTDVTPEIIDQFLAARKTSPSGKDTDRRAVSRFFSWCMERQRRWTAVNPCAQVRVEMGEKATPAILTLKQCKDLLKKTAKFKDGRLAPYVSVCLFGGLRPFEAQRLTWQAVNLKDGEIRLDGNQTKTGRARVVAICDTLRAWLKQFKNMAFFPSNWRKDFDAVKAAAGYGVPTEEAPDLKPWVDDILRHTAISHYFRKTRSYGETAEQFGNSEAIIKHHYQGRVTSVNAEKFYSLLP
jgi:integrase